MSLEGTNFNISIKSIDDLARCLSLASLLELAGWPKPGNVHRTRDFENTRFEHFLAGITAIQPNFREFCEKILQIPFKNEEDYEKIEMGLFFKKATEEMIKWQGGGNVLLGHILILAPLSAAAIICLKTKKCHIDDLKHNLGKLIEKSTEQDTVNMYEAIRLCNPGGLGKIEKYDGIDLFLGGIGPDGHIAFNEPGSPFDFRTRIVNLSERTIKDNARFFKSIDEVPRQALSMGMGTIMEVRKIILLASGVGKAEAVVKSVEGPITTDVPSSILQKHPNCIFILDEEAASKLVRKAR